MDPQPNSSFTDICRQKSVFKNHAHISKMLCGCLGNKGIPGVYLVYLLSVMQQLDFSYLVKGPAEPDYCEMVQEKNLRCLHLKKNIQKHQGLPGLPMGQNVIEVLHRTNYLS